MSEYSISSGRIFQGIYLANRRILTYGSIEGVELSTCICNPSYPIPGHLYDYLKKDLPLTPRVIQELGDEVGSYVLTPTI